jgi:hypothetical protein
MATKTVPHLSLLRFDGARGRDDDTVQRLRSLLEQAEAGELVGLAWVAMYRGRDYTVNTCGAMHKNPTFCRGAIAALSDEVSRHQWGA